VRRQTSLYRGLHRGALAYTSDRKFAIEKKLAFAKKMVSPLGSFHPCDDKEARDARLDREKTLYRSRYTALLGGGNPGADLKQFVGGEAFNGKFFLDLRSESFDLSPPGRRSHSVSDLSQERRLRVRAGRASPPSLLCTPLRDTSTPDSGTLGSTAQVAGFDQLIIYGKARAPVYVSSMGEGQVRVRSISVGKDTVETTVRLQKWRETVTWRFSVSGLLEKRCSLRQRNQPLFLDGGSRGAGAVFGAKHLKPFPCGVAVRSDSSSTNCFSSDAFLFMNGCAEIPCLRLREEGPFLYLGGEGAGLGIKNL